MLADAAKRKARQETGLKVKVLKYVGYYDDPRIDPRGSLIIHSFLARPTGGKLKKDGLEWFKKAPKGMGFKFQIKELKDAGLI
jgi:ADP-ribose pyrophosphatase YjhB (NUDIX family)